MYKDSLPKIFKIFFFIILLLLFSGCVPKQPQDTQVLQTVWQRTFGGSYYDFAYYIQQTKDEGYIVAGWTSSFGEGIVDFYIIKTNSNGNTGPYPQVQGAQGVLKGFKPQETLFEKFFPQRLFKK